MGSITVSGAGFPTGVKNMGGAINLQACKFTKNELLHTHFSKILAGFYAMVLHIAMGGDCFSDGGWLHF